MSVPSWWEFVLLGAAAWRSWQLLAHDDILDRPRRWLLRLGDEWRRSGDSVPADYRYEWAKFLVCPFCFGFWVALAWWGMWQISEHWTLVFAAPFALSVVVVSGARLLTEDE